MTSDESIVSISEIRMLCDEILEAIVEQYGDSISLEKDYYWYICSEERYNVYKDPTDLTLGQLSDELDSVRQIVHRGDFVPSGALVWVGHIIEAIGDELYESGKLRS